MASPGVAPGREARAAVTGAEHDSLLLPWTFNLMLLIATGQPPPSAKKQALLADSKGTDRSMRQVPGRSKVLGGYLMR